MVDALDLKSSIVRCEGSSPSMGSQYYKGLISMNTKTAKKEFRKSQKRNFLNNLKKNNAKKIKKKLLIVLTENKAGAKDSSKDLSNYNSILAKMAKTKLIHANKASRLISRMQKKISSI